MIKRFIVNRELFTYVPECECPSCGKLLVYYRLNVRGLPNRDYTCVHCFSIIQLNVNKISLSQECWEHHYLQKIDNSYKKACIKREMLDKIKKL